jgi:hypothetical protein
MPKPNLILPPQAQAVDPGQRGANRVKGLLRRQAGDLEQMVRQLHTVVQRNGRSAIETALGPDAGELETLYNALKTAAETLGAEDLPDLPPAS